MNDLKAVVFDYGGVLVEYQQAAELRRLESLSGLDSKGFHAAYWEFRLAYDRGDLDGPAYWAEIARVTGRTYPAETLKALVEVDSQSWTHLNERMVRWVRKLQAAGITTAIISNLSIELRTWLEGMDWVRACRQRTYSCDIRVAKPDAPIYRHCLEGLGLRPEQTLFLDDKMPNVEGARAVGMNALLFTSADNLAPQAATMGLPRLDP